MSKPTKQSKKSGKKISLQSSSRLLVDAPQKFLSENPIYFESAAEERESTIVPPNTPEHISSIIRQGNQIPAQFPSLATFEIPHVKDVGIKKCIEILGDHLGCTNFVLDHLQFWFLDMLTDCLRKTQDDYHLTEGGQKIVLEWILHVFQIIADPKMTFSRKRFFNIIKEAILIAGDVINEGELEVPHPETLFTLIQGEDKDEANDLSTDDDSSCASESTTSASSRKSEDPMEAQIGDKTNEFDIITSSRTYEHVRKENSCEMVQFEGYGEFLNPEPECSDHTVSEFVSIPRFECKYLAEVMASRGEADYPCYCTQYSGEASFDTGEFEYLDLSEKAKEISDVEILTKLTNYKLLEQMFKDMGDPRRVWLPIKNRLENIKTDESSDEVLCVYGDVCISQCSSEESSDDGSRKHHNMNVLLAIIDLVFQYFHQSFHFALIKLATHATPDVIAQKINTEWKVPKVCKKEQKPEKQREKNLKKDKKKSSEIGKSPKDLKEGKEKKKVGKKGDDKISEDNSSKQTEKNEKSVVEGKNELDTQEEEKRRAQENKRFILPLKDAACDKLFKRIFDNWVKPNED